MWHHPQTPLGRHVNCEAWQCSAMHDRAAMALVTWIDFRGDRSIQRLTMSWYLYLASQELQYSIYPLLTEQVCDLDNMTTGPTLARQRVEPKRLQDEEGGFAPVSSRTRRAKFTHAQFGVVNDICVQLSH